ncbi:type I glyceraldehyde-3-phosphate dehydrogenase [Mycobacterium malmoense]|uniref:Glyceraldehyde-3-phosphate dehydrogenase n=1 Tax=Mycobacterium malmoense TaxID=1780 RepID=A0ABX3ST38_MYCMA|nr:type I glyceraldehyde-3-phosphate dehydrogenase [Mycobacterium malmoense]OIN78922.1 type I glyceraldehyde-3-phosphate dehydrogenase [Mycobacterium malmoense]ORA83674.1 type I glyceraldehyde-3-phosphate dehydrogenase [Mycobacterium malmoense]QZA18789.1 type I glyceraldehyde-3-phosphate dehydrogenase [Mycobacterium malmoense]UNB95559.1 type I glyceraldehyde-3-phosphate dehydrogenase [Mycobacterium malmoense]
MVARVAINGLGRIGRATLKSVLGERGLELAAVNDVAPIDNLAYLLRYDTVYGRADSTVSVADSMISVAGQRIKVLNEADPTKLPWRDLKVDLVFECTGAFRRSADLRAHLDAGARRVILSAPAKDELATIVYGVNEHDAAGQEMMSNASCTTNCIAPVMEILHRGIGVQKATMTTVHAYTSSQKLVDGPARKWRRGRAAGANIIPTSTGAAEATGRVVPAVAGRFDGIALRVPVPVGSIADIVALVSRETSVEEVNDLFRTEASSERYRGVLGVSEEPIVSADVIADPRASVVDATLTTVTGGDLVKVMAWYDNEWGYAQQMIRQALLLVGESATTR